MHTHFYDPATSTITQARVRGYGISGWYFYTSEAETEVIGPFESFEDAEYTRRKTASAVRRDDFDGF